MQLKINFHQIESTPAIKEMIQHKSEKLKKFFDGNFDINWTCSTGKEGHHSHALLNYNGHTINADSTKDDLYKTFDDIISKLERQLLKKKSMIKDKIHHKHEVNIEDLDNDFDE